MSNSKIEQFLWILYTDANARFNTLIEECAHLQETIVNFVSNYELFIEIADENSDATQVQGFKRTVFCSPKKHPKYYGLSVGDRTLLGLWNVLGANIVGASENQITHRDSYERAIAQFLIARNASRLNAPGDEFFDLYWYLNTRGYFMREVCEHYTQQIEHAHESLIQLLENQAGNLPNPLLFRRWSSAMYGDFLSEYSRHVNWETGQVISRLSQGRKKSPQNDNTATVSHSWAHRPTSYTTLSDQYFQGKHVTSKTKNRFGIVRSAYFYLEQPILLPLLYHECIHVNFPSDVETEITGSHRTFFGSRLETLKSLRRAQFKSEVYGNFWDHFTEEVWTDALSIALQGRGYLVALSLQLFGLSGNTAFSHFNFEEDVVYPLTDLGKREKRAYQPDIPELRDEHFWEARLLLACKVLRKTCADTTQSALAAEVVESIETLISGWFSGGKAANNEYKVSPVHSEWFDYRKDLNQWVVKTTWRYMEKGLPELLSSDAICSTYVLKGETTYTLIDAAVNNYRKKYGLEASKQFSLLKGVRLEDVPFDVRWSLSEELVEKITIDNVSALTDNFASWLRHDGAAAFRMALEWFRVRNSLMDTVADAITTADPAKQFWASSKSDYYVDKVQALSKAVSEHITGRSIPLIDAQEALRRRSLTNKHPPLAFIGSENIFLGKFERLADDGVQHLITSLNSQKSPREVPIGTLSLGAIRPKEFAVDSGYRGALIRARDASADGVTIQNQLASDTSLLGQTTEDTFKSKFIPLIGEYQYVHFTGGSTPVERDAHPEHMPRTLLKPRLVLQAGGVSLDKIRDPINGEVGRLTLLRLKYRWQWVTLQNLLAAHFLKAEHQKQSGQFSLYLSSAWEDVVLYTVHTDANDAWNLHNELGLDVAFGFVDMQSSFSVDGADADPQPAPLQTSETNDWREMFSQWASKSPYVESTSERTGRFDFTVIWKTPTGGENCFISCKQGLCSMPLALWKRVGSISCSFEKTHNTRSSSNVEELVAISHIALDI